MTENEDFWKIFLEELDEMADKIKNSNNDGKKEALDACDRIRELIN